MRRPKAKRGPRRSGPLLSELVIATALAGVMGGLNATKTKTFLLESAVSVAKPPANLFPKPARVAEFPRPCRRLFRRHAGYLGASSTITAPRPK